MRYNRQLDIDLEEMLDEYKSYFMRLNINGRKIVDYYPTESNELIVVFNDGVKDMYDLFDKSSLRICMSRRDWGTPYSEQVWQKLFARRLYKTIIMKGYTIDDFAYEIGISSKTLYNYCNYISSPSIFKLREIAEVLGYDVSYFTTFTK